MNWQSGRRAGIISGAALMAAGLSLSASGGSTPAADAATGATVAAAEPPAPAVPAPFGLGCTPEDGIRLCVGGLTGGVDHRVKSFDGVPLDADVALPASGSGPFPLIVLLHGLGESKAEYETTRDDGAVDDVTLADQGYAVLMYTARGFGNSCGTKASRTGVAGCDKGWIQLADQRYEVRDTQYLAGLLVDEGLVKANIAVAGVSYGAGQSLELAMEKNRMRLPDGRFVPFVSPIHHVAMSVAAAYAMWPWDDLVTALDPNGNLSTVQNTPAGADADPAGVAKESWDKLLYGVTATNYLAPPGVDPQSDLTTWEREILAGEPYLSPERSSLHIIQEYKSAIGIPMAPGGPAATAIQSGWTDSLFPVSEGLHYANAVKAAGDHPPMLLMFDDVGHGWAQDKAADVATTNNAGIAFVNSVMLTHTRPKTGVLAIAQTCPATAPSGPASTGVSMKALAPSTVQISGVPAQSVTSSGGDPTTAAHLDPAYSSTLCDPLPAAREPGTAVYDTRVGPDGLTLLGGTKITAHLHIVGNYPELIGRLWDVAPGATTRQIVAMGIFRPSVSQAAGTGANSTASQQGTFELNPNEYHFAPGDTIELELVGSNAPYFRASNGTYVITVSGLRATLPTR
jgi:acetyl esterase/lipase